MKNKDELICYLRGFVISKDVFNFDDDNLAEVIENPVKEEHYEDANMAKESCPTGAIEEE